MQRPDTAASGFDSLTASENAIEVRLEPEELGKLSIRFEGRGEAAQTAVVSVERSETLHFIRQNMALVEKMISEAGYSGADISFEQQADQNSSGPSQNQNENFTYTLDEILQDEAISARQALNRFTNGDGLNIQL